MIPTASQTVGPFFNYALTTDASLGVLVKDGVPGERIHLEFRVTDGNGDPTPADSMIELWQADAAGSYKQTANFHGFGRLETNLDGVCVFETIKPGRVDGQAPHINVIVFARGLLRHLYTRVYFAGDAANGEDAVLALVPESRRATLFAQPAGGKTWRMNVCLQGDGETVFFDL
jgi:protocatechuate 3,4-dioxygenase, alpha subunit